MLRTPFDEPVVIASKVLPHPSPHKRTTNLVHHAAIVVGSQKPESIVITTKRKQSVSVEELDGLASAAVLQKVLTSSSDPNFFDDERLIRHIQILSRKSEREHLPSISLFQNNLDIMPTMRCKLINWLIEVSLHFRLHRETFYLSVHYLDRFLSLHWGISRESLQLIGIACLFIAAKLEEIYPPKLKDFAEICDGSCSNDCIFQMELEVLMAIQWRLNVPTIYYWLGSYLELLRSHLNAEAIEPLRSFSLELIDLAIHTPISLMYSYSLMAASALYLRLQNEALLIFCSGYSFREMKPCVDWLWSLFSCPECIIYLHPDDRVDGEDFDSAVSTNTRIMNYLMEQIRRGNQ